MIGRIKRIFFGCNHKWTKTYDGYVFKSQYTCKKCGKIVKKEFYDESSWRVQRRAKGDTFE